MTLYQLYIRPRGTLCQWYPTICSADIALLEAYAELLRKRQLETHIILVELPA